MTREVLEREIAALEAELRGIRQRKSGNYANDQNTLQNFDLIEYLTNEKMSTEQGIFVRMGDKMARLGNLMFGVQDEVGESIEDSLLDLINYAKFAVVKIRQRRGGPAPEAVEDAKETIARSILDRLKAVVREAA